MRADELMMGDWVLYDGEEEQLKGKPIQVTGICAEIIQGSFSEEKYEILSYWKIKPIPINEGILEKNGWKTDGVGNIFKEPYILTRTKVGWNVYYYLARIAEIRFFHELQNIMRMTGYQGGFKV